MNSFSPWVPTFPGTSKPILGKRGKPRVYSLTFSYVMFLASLRPHDIVTTTAVQPQLSV